MDRKDFNLITYIRRLRKDLDDVASASGGGGPAGACGVSGVPGACGVSGVSGVPGACGVSGVSGISGVPGAAGACGISGVAGTNGACGVSGVAGACGVSGTAGAVGACGVSGVAGACGVSGVAGTNGTNGACGVSGTAGAAGACGVSGVAGACGVSGVAGTNGACGVSGVSGIAGTPGGAASWLGPWVTATAYAVDDIVSNGGSSWICIVAHTSGATTEPGVGVNYTDKWILVAEKGACGVSGTAGACGVSGIAGACGVSGVAGTAGACGVSGVSGVTGVPGTNGACGVSGTAGACGVSGIAGVSGMILPYAGRIAPTGWLNCDGSAVSRTTYAALFAAIAPTLGTFTVTIATPAVVSKTAHGLSTGDVVYLTTSGALPTGLSANTLYYVVRVDANSFNLSTTRANAYAGTKIATSGTQSGTHTVWDCPYGLGDGSTTFTLPDLRGRALAGMDTTAGTAASRLTLAQTEGVYGNLGAAGGEQGHQLSVAELASHTHAPGSGAAFANYVASGGTQNLAGAGQITTAGATAAAGSNTSHNTVQPVQLVNFIIKT